MKAKRITYTLERDVDGIPAGTVGVVSGDFVTFKSGVQSLIISRKFLSTYPIKIQGN